MHACSHTLQHDDIDDLDPLSDPLTFEDAISRPDGEKWIEAMQEEINSLLEKGTFAIDANKNCKLEPLHSATQNTETVSNITTEKPLSTKWVYKTKQYTDGRIRYKARLVVRGFEQIEGVDFDETYAPVSRLTTLRVIIALCALHGWKMSHLDVVTAFLNPKVDRDNLFVKLPKGIELIAPDNTQLTKTLRLLKALYGLRQSSKLWYDDINQTLLTLGFNQSVADPNLYIRDGVLILLYIDDLLIVHRDSDTTNVAEDIKQKLMTIYRMTDLGLATKFIGIEIGYKKSDTGHDSITLSQSGYIRQMLKRYKMEDAYPVSTPMDLHTDLFNGTCKDSPLDEFLQKEYTSIVGSLMYAALGTRPDIAYPVMALSKFSTRPLTMHMTAAKRVLRYLKGTVNLKLQYDHTSTDMKTTTPTVIGFSDSDWAGSLSTRKSTSGFIFKLGSGCISWRAKTQTIVALSTLEAEFIACSSATREALWLRRIMADIFGDPYLLTPTKMFCDNQGALKIIETGVLKGRSKHIDVQFHHTSDEHRNHKSVHFSYVKSSDNPADLLTKSLPAPKINFILDLIHLSN